MPDEISLVDILILPGILTFLGLLWYGIYWSRGRVYEQADKRRWGSLILLVLAVFVGAKWALEMRDPFYRAQFIGPGTRKIVFGHYFALIGPILSIVAVIVIDKFTERSRRY